MNRNSPGQHEGEIADRDLEHLRDLARLAPDDLSRRDFMRLMAAPLALAGVGAMAGCPSPREEIIPYVVPPELAVPGKPLFFATTMPMAGYGIGLLAESHMGRPTKLEGNPDHPASLGASDAWTQASILSLYDPDRAQTVTRRGQISTWAAFTTFIAGELAARRETGGRGIRLLTGAVTSPTLLAQLQAFLQQYPGASWHHYEPVCLDAERAGTRAAFGRIVNPVYRFDRAQRILSLDADFLLFGPGVVRYNRDFAAGRRVRAGGPDSMHRLYAVESTPTITGAMADHRLAIPASDVERIARLTLAAVRGTPPPADDPHAQWVAAMADDLLQHRGGALAVAGPWQPPAVHAIAHILNAELGAVGRTVVYTEPVEAAQEGDLASLTRLVTDMRAGAVDMLIILDANPVYTAPADLDFPAAMDAVPLRIHLSEFYDETSFRSHWHIPLCHYLEMWSDARAFDGSASVVQPLIHPLYQSRSPHEFMAALLGQPESDARELVRRTWQSRAPDPHQFEPFWRAALERGAIPDTAAQEVRVSVAGDPLAEQPPAPAHADGLELTFRPDPGVYDGRFANNGWLQELPKPITKLTWDNVALISPATAASLGLASGDVVTLRHAGRQADAPVWVQPGQPDNSISVQLGYGRDRAGRVGSNVGFSAFALRTSGAMWTARGVEILPTGRRHPLACTQPSQALGGRDIFRVHSLAQLAGEAAEDKAHAPSGHGRTLHLSLYPPMPGSQINHGHAWGMVVDLNVCTGCSACVVACQAENNVSIVGKDQVLAGREMHWIRIDTYYKGDRPSADAGPYFEPMLCQHCQNAPCEYVCPVLATTHSAEGVNEMTYNRCIGTRYCANNCPYKVRRFNFLQYADHTPVRQLGYNPDVTVRTRGVMEKCTFCIQRINEARREEKTILARNGPDARARADAVVDALQTACQQACPAGAIVFGDLQRPSPVAALRDQPHGFAILTGLNTQPRVSYLPRLVNPNPALPTSHHALDHPERTFREEAKG